MMILVIGAKGMLGQALVAEFGAGVTAWDREDVDVTSRGEVGEKVNGLHPDLVINSSAYTDVDRAESNPDSANKVNGLAVGYLAEACKNLDIPLVHFSTEYVFDGQNQAGYAEDAIPNPVSAYGQSKYLGEQELHKHTNKFYLIRLSRLFGKKGSGKTSFVESMLATAKSKTEIEVVDEEISLPTYAQDLAGQVKKIVGEGMPFGIYHCPNSGDPVTWYGFAKEIFKIAGINAKLKAVPASHFPRPARRPQYGVLLNTKLPAMRPWEEGLQEFINKSNV